MTVGSAGDDTHEDLIALDDVRILQLHREPHLMTNELL